MLEASSTSRKIRGAYIWGIRKNGTIKVVQLSGDSLTERQLTNVTHELGKRGNYLTYGNCRTKDGLEEVYLHQRLIKKEYEESRKR